MSGLVIAYLENKKNTFGLNPNRRRTAGGTEQAINISIDERSTE